MFRFFIFTINKKTDMQEAEIRTFAITGDAAKAYIGGSKKRRTAKRKEGVEVPSQTVSAPNADPMVAALDKPVSVVTPPIVPKTPAVIQRAGAAPELPRFQVVSGDSKKIKVELNKKQNTKKVQLHPKKDEPAKVPMKKSVTKKNRKMLLGVSALHRRMTRAKKMQKKAKEMPLDKLKEELVQKKLIKATSKAPESVLRQIAADAQIVEGKAL